jgi:hypothetical protein
MLGTLRQKEITMDALEIRMAKRLVEGAIDRMVELQDLGLGDDAVARILEMLNRLEGRIREIKPSGRKG